MVGGFCGYELYIYTPTHFDHKDGGSMYIRNVGNIATSTRCNSSRTKLTSISTITSFPSFLTHSGSHSCLPSLTQSFLHSHLIIVLQRQTANKKLYWQWRIYSAEMVSGDPSRRWWWGYNTSDIINIQHHRITICNKQFNMVLIFTTLRELNIHITQILGCNVSCELTFSTFKGILGSNENDILWILFSVRNKNFVHSAIVLKHGLTVVNNSF
jgi:hypothetical protein